MVFQHIGSHTATANIPIVVKLEDVYCHAQHESTPNTTISASSFTGATTCTINSSSNFAFNWIDPTFNAPGNPPYEIKRGLSAPFDLNTGEGAGYGPLQDVWSPVTTSWGWALTPETVSSAVATFTVSIRQGSGPVIDTATWTISVLRAAESGGGGGGCFTGDMLVLMADGTEKAIADIFVGHEVMSLNTKTNELVSARVHDIMVPRICNIYKIKLSNGKTIETTSEHPFRTADGRWANVDPTATYQPKLGGKNVTPDVDAQLKEGMLLHGIEGNAKIMKIIETGRKETVYHLSRVGTHHNFFVEGMCVHNIFDEEEFKE